MANPYATAPARKLPIGIQTFRTIGMEFSRAERNLAAFTVERA